MLLREIPDKSYQRIEDNKIQKDIEVNSLYKQEDETQEEEIPENEEEESQEQNTSHEESLE